MKDRNIIDYLSMLCLGVYLLFFCYLFFDMLAIELEYIILLFFIIIFVLNFAPHIILMICMFNCKSFILKFFMFMVQFGLTIFSIYALYQTFYIARPDALSVIGFVFLPLLYSFPIVFVTLVLKGFIQYIFKNSKLFNE